MYGKIDRRVINMNKIMENIKHKYFHIYLGNDGLYYISSYRPNKNSIFITSDMEIAVNFINVNNQRILNTKGEE